MSSVEKYFKEKVNNVSFIEIKEDTNIKIKDYKLNPDIPLPLIVSELISEIKEHRAQEELKITSIINGMIYLLGTDSKFLYNSEYKNILYTFDKNIEDYILYNSFKLIENNKIDDGIIYLRALININSNHKIAYFNYGLSLERKSNEAYNNDDSRKGNVYLKESTKIFEEVLELDDKYPPVYYKLGYHYMNMNQFVKAKLTWDRFIELSEDENLKEEVLENLTLIKNNIDYEEGCNDVLCGNPSKGLEKLLPLKEKYNDWWNLLFMIGISFRQLGMYNEAKEEFENILKIKPNQVDTLNELGLCLANLGLNEEAIEKFSSAIELQESYEILCNRGMTYLQIGKITEATTDINRAYEMNPEDEITISCMEQLQYINKS